MTRWLCIELLNEELVCLKVVFKQILLCADTVILPNDQNLSFGDGDETHPIYLVGHFLRLSTNMYKQH